LTLTYDLDFQSQACTKQFQMSVNSKDSVETNGRYRLLYLPGKRSQ